MKSKQQKPSTQKARRNLEEPKRTYQKKIKQQLKTIPDASMKID